MQILTKISFYGLLMLTLSQSALAQLPTFRDLFNGENLDGWIDVNTSPSTWSVRDGMLVCSGHPIGVMRSDRQYENFIISVEWRHMEPGGNSGIFLWSDAVPGKNRLPMGMEVQMLELDWVNQHPRPDGSLPPIAYVHGELFGAGGMTATPENPRGNRSKSVENRCKGVGQWNHYLIVAIDGSVKLAVNGKFVNGIRDASLKKGYLCLESEGAEIHFRNLQIMELPSGLADADTTAALLTGKLKPQLNDESETAKASPSPAPKSTNGKRRVNPVLAPIEDDLSLPRVLLIGDSISMGYTLPVREILKGQANVHRPATNCGPTTKGLAELDEWLGDKPWDVIHFNFGLHDLKYMGPNGENLADPAATDSHQQVPPDQYRQNLQEIVRRLQQTGAKLIWRTTTPVPDGAAGRLPGDAAKYNLIAAEIMQMESIPVDDQYRYAMQDLSQIQKPANVHFTPDGSERLAEQTVLAIRQALGLPTP